MKAPNNEFRIYEFFDGYYDFFFKLGKTRFEIFIRNVITLINLHSMFI